MYIQLIIFLIAYLGLFLFKEEGGPARRQRARKYYIVLMMVILALQSGLRNIAVGADTFAYYNLFNRTMNSSWNQVLYEISQHGNKDPGYTLLTKLFSLIVPNFRLFLIVIAAFFFTSLGRILFRYLNSNIEVFVSIALYECLYYGFFSITGIRQTVATGILLFALPLVFNKRDKLKSILLFIILVVIASTIHRSALLFAPMLLLPRLRNSKIVFIIAFVLFVPMFSAGSFLGDLLTKSDFEEYAHYLEQSETTGALVFSVYIVALVLATFIKLKTVNSFSQYNYVFSSAIAIAMLLTPLLVLNPSNQRIVQYYSIFGLIMLPQICRAYSGSRKGKLLFYLVFLVFSLYTIMRKEIYAFYWQDMMLNDGSRMINDSILFN